jgi:hypothetical protein
VEVTQSAPSVVATQKLAVAQETLPSSFAVSEVTVDQEAPPSGWLGPESEAQLGLVATCYNKYVTYCPSFIDASSSVKKRMSMSIG